MLSNCDCHSYNKDVGGNPEKLLKVPDYLNMHKEYCSIDSRISHVIQHLWNNQVITVGCCCGHGKNKPSIILNQNSGEKWADTVRDYISLVDDRDFDLLSWKMMNI